MASEPRPTETVLFRWERNVPLLTNRFILYDLAKLVVITALIMFVLVEGMILVLEGFKWEMFKSMAMAAGIGALALTVLMVFAMLAVFWNRFPMGFFLNAKGAAVASLSARGNVANRLAVILGMLAGKPGVAGAGLLGLSQEQVGITWTEVQRLNIHPEQRVISLMNSWRVVVRLYCTPENFDAVRDQVQAWWQAAAPRRLARSRRQVWFPWGPLLLQSALTVTAAFFLQALPFSPPGLWILVLALAALMAVWPLPWRHLAGLATLAGVSLFLIFTLVQGFQSFRLFDENLYRTLAQEKGWPKDPLPVWVTQKRYRFQTLRGAEWLGLGVGGLCLAWLTYVGVAAALDWPERKKDAGRRSKE